MWPFLEIAGISFPTYNIILAFGIILALIVLIFAARRKRVSLHFLADHFIVIFLATFFTARIVQIWLHDYSLWSFPFFWQESSGFYFYGGVVGFLLTLFIFCRKSNENFLLWLDLTMIPAGIALVFHHLGSFFSGANYGIPTTLPFGVIFTNPSSAVLTTLPIHPVQLYNAVFTLIFVLLAGAIFKRTTSTGKAGIFLLMTLSISSFFFDFFSFCFLFPQ